MRKPLVTSLFLMAVAALAVAATTGAGTASRPRKRPSRAVRLDSLNLAVEDGVLTVGADNPAFPPWFGGAEKTPWKVSDPYSGKGYESAVVYAVASQLGFPKAKSSGRSCRSTTRSARGRSRSTSTSPRSRSRPRARQGGRLRRHYFVNQAVVGRKGTPIAKA